MSRYGQAMFANEMEIGGSLSCELRESPFPQNQIWFIGKGGRLFAKITIDKWDDADAVAEAIGETLEFVRRKKREPIYSLWVSDFREDEFTSAMETFATHENPKEKDNDFAEPTVPQILLPPRF